MISAHRRAAVLVAAGVASDATSLSELVAAAPAFLSGARPGPGLPQGLCARCLTSEILPSASSGFCSEVVLSTKPSPAPDS